MMTIGEVSRLTGVTERALRHYDKMGLLVPARTGEGVANNRRLYTEEHLDRLRNIVVLQEYGLELSEIGAILDEGFPAMRAALQARLDDLRREQNRLKNLILFAKFAEMLDDDLFEGLVCGPTDLDDLADLVRGTERYGRAVERYRSKTDEERDEMLGELDDIVGQLIHVEDDEGFAGVERCMQRFRLWWDARIAPLDELGYLGFWAVFEDETSLAARAEQVGGQEISGDIQMFMFYSALRKLMLDLGSLIADIARDVDEDVAAAVAQLDDLADHVAQEMGVRCGGGTSGDDEPSRQDILFLCDTILFAMADVLEDDELKEYLDPQGDIALSAGALAKVTDLAALVIGEEALEG